LHLSIFNSAHRSSFYLIKELPSIALMLAIKAIDQKGVHNEMVY
jgi:hypothetical protein